MQAAHLLNHRGQLTAENVSRSHWQMRRLCLSIRRSRLLSPGERSPAARFRAIVERDVATVDEAGEVLAVKTFVGIYRQRDRWYRPVTEFDSGETQISFPFRLYEDPNDSTDGSGRYDFPIGLIRYEVPVMPQAVEERIAVELVNRLKTDRRYRRSKYDARQRRTRGRDPDDGP